MGSGLPQILLLSPVHQGAHGKAVIEEVVLWASSSLRGCTLCRGWTSQHFVPTGGGEGQQLAHLTGFSPGSLRTAHAAPAPRLPPLSPKEDTLRTEAVSAGALANEHVPHPWMFHSARPSLHPVPRWGGRSPACSVRRIPVPPLRYSRLKVAVPLEGKRQRQTARLRDAGRAMRGHGRLGAAPERRGVRERRGLRGLGGQVTACSLSH